MNYVLGEWNAQWNAIRLLYDLVFPISRNGGLGFSSLIFFYDMKILWKVLSFLAFHLVCKLTNCKSACLKGFYSPPLFIHVMMDEFLLCCWLLFYLKNSPSSIEVSWTSPVSSWMDGVWRVGSRLSKNVFPGKPFPIGTASITLIWMSKKGEILLWNLERLNFHVCRTWKACDYLWLCSQ